MVDSSKNPKTAQSQEESVVLSQDVTETKKHFALRKQVFDAAVADGVTQERAVVLSQVFKNAYYMGTSYPESVMLQSKKYWPKECIANPIYTTLD